MVARRRGLSIGAVLDRLTDEFPDLSISKLRFLESEGLVTPQRATSGYRLYSEDDVRRIRYVLTAQRERFWPLKVIREALDAMDRGLQPVAEAANERPTVPVPSADPGLPTAAELTASARLRLTEPELIGAAGLDQATFQALRGFQLLRPDGGGHYDDAALSIASAAAALAAYGVEARHLRPFRTAAEREVGLVQQIAGPALASSSGQDPTGDLLRQCLALHSALVRAELRRG